MLMMMMGLSRVGVEIDGSRSTPSVFDGYGHELGMDMSRSTLELKTRIWMRQHLVMLKGTMCLR